MDTATSLYAIIVPNNSIIIIFCMCSSVLKPSILNSRCATESVLWLDVSQTHHSLLLLFETVIRYGKATIIMTITLFNYQLQANLEVWSSVHLNEH